ncbi:hypothetical protein [Maribacter sp. LLG6340-A2]|uniref:hypothetical protein n=1 Tax=Maribacter sp. LLG6340-A2 TaxID=3160834 RepID=UPI00386B311E
MKYLLLLSISFLFFSCNKQSFNDISENSNKYKVIGKAFDENGNFTSDIFYYDNLSLEVDQLSSIKVRTQNYSQISYNAFYADINGITGRGHNFDTGRTHVYHENFNKESAKTNIEIAIEGYLHYSFHMNEKIYAFYQEDFVQGEIGTKFQLLIFDINTQEKKSIQIGVFNKIRENYVRLVPINNQLYIYLSQNAIEENPQNYLILFDLKKEEIIETRDNFKFDNYAVVADDTGNCYLLGIKSVYKYEFNLKTMTDFGPIGNGFFQFNYYLDPSNPMSISDDKLYFGTVGGFPGSGATYPAILDLNTGDFKVIDIFEDETQFEDDEFPWNPHAQSFTVDYENKVFLIGAHSSRIGMPYKSQGIFTVDFDGNVLSKEKTPVVPFQIIN